MKHEHVVQAEELSVLDRIKSEYAELAQSRTFSLEELFSPQAFQFDEFCKTFSGYPQSEELQQLSEAFGREYGVWQAHTKYYINCAFLLYPRGCFDRMLTILKNLTVGFYLNDIMGRDVFKFLSPEEQKRARKLIKNMADLDETIDPGREAGPIEIANAIALREFRDAAPREWFLQFKRLYSYHLKITHRDCDTDAVGYLPEVDEYITRRCHLAGMNHIVLWVEFSDGRFLDWELLKKHALSLKMERLHWLSAAFGALSNDLFSFEKEVIDNSSDSNLVAIVAMNKPYLSLQRAIEESSEIVRNVVMELVALLDSMPAEIARLEVVQPALAETLSTHLKGLVRFIQASWLWQLHAKRYKRASSIWHETTLGATAVNA
jgi:hypothetical protein